MIGSKTQYDPQIDMVPVEGLSGTPDSLAYKVEEIEKHLHNAEQWFGKDGVDNFLNRDSLTAFQVTAGTGEAYGTELQISDGDEIESGSATKKFDFHELLVITASAVNATYKLEIYTGTSTFGAATLSTEATIRIGSAANRSAPIRIQNGRQTCNNKIWVRLKCTTNSATVDFIVGVHTYEA